MHVIGFLNKLLSDVSFCKCRKSSVIGNMMKADNCSFSYVCNTALNIRERQPHYPDFMITEVSRENNSYYPHHLHTKNQEVRSF